MKRTAAFFDIDGTLYREGLITEVFKKIIRYDLVDENLWHDEVKPAFMKFMIRKINTNIFHKQTIIRTVLPDFFFHIPLFKIQ